MESEFILDNWKYEGKVDSGKLVLNVSAPNKSKPDSLFKLFGIAQHNVEAFYNNVLYANHRDQFNDIYDAHPNLIKDMSAEQEKEFLNLLIANYGQAKVNSFNEADLKQYLLEIRSQVINSYFGLICMSEEYDNVLMWAYYGVNSGYMIEYDTASFDSHFIGPFPINYQKQVLPIESQNLTMPVSTLYQATVKSKRWEHENEWRYLVRPGSLEKGVFELTDGSPLNKEYQSSRLIPYAQNAVKSIRLGNRFFRNSEMKLVDGNRVEVLLEKTDYSKLRDILLKTCLERELPISIAIQQNDMMSIFFKPFKLTRVKELQYILT